MKTEIRLAAIACVSLLCGCFGNDGGGARVSQPDATTDVAAPIVEAGAPAPPNPLVGAAFGPTIDDMSMAQSTTHGSWYTYSARTVPNSEPAILTTDAGVLDPLEGAAFPPNNGSGSVPALVLDGGALGYREFSGHGIVSWGAGFGMDLVSARPDGGPVAVDMCGQGAIFDTSPEAGAVGIPQPYDASAYAGFAFWGLSRTETDLSIEVHVDDSDTTPWGGTFCDPCRSAGKCTGSPADGGLDCPCSDNFYEVVTLPHGRWTQFAVRWKDAAFQANHWSGEGVARVRPDAGLQYPLSKHHFVRDDAALRHRRGQPAVARPLIGSRAARPASVTRHDDRSDRRCPTMSYRFGCPRDGTLRAGVTLPSTDFLPASAIQPIERLNARRQSIQPHRRSPPSQETWRDRARSSRVVVHAGCAAHARDKGVCLPMKIRRFAGPALALGAIAACSSATSPGNGAGTGAGDTGGKLERLIRRGGPVEAQQLLERCGRRRQLRRVGRFFDGRARGRWLGRR